MRHITSWVSGSGHLAAPSDPTGWARVRWDAVKQNRTGRGPGFEGRRRFGNRITVMRDADFQKRGGARRMNGSQ